MADDQSLIMAARAGDQRAYTALYRNYHRRALREARQVVRNAADAEDCVAAAFASTFLAIRKGGGPDESLRASLLTAVHNAALQLVRTKHDGSASVGPAPEPAAIGIDAYATGADPAVREAFQRLPGRWQQVLWTTEIDGRPPADPTGETEGTAASNAALAARARDDFGTALLTIAIGPDPHPWAAERLDLLREGALDARTRDLVELHVENCARCQAVFAPVPAAPASLGLILLLGGAVAPSRGVGAAAAGGALLGRLRHLGSRTATKMSARVATVSAASVAVVGTLLVVGISARSDSTSRPSSPSAISSPLPGATDAGGGGGGPGSGATGSMGTGSMGTGPGATSPSSGASPGVSDAGTTTTVVAVLAPVAGGSTGVSAPDLAGSSHTTVRTTRPTTERRGPGSSTSTSPPAPSADPSAPPASTAPPPSPPPETNDAASPATVATAPPTTPAPTATPTAAPTVTTAPTVVTTATTAPPSTEPPTTGPTTPGSTLPPDYAGTVSFKANGVSTAIAAIVATGADGLPAGTTFRFTLSSHDPSWTVSFGDIHNCTGLPATLPGDSTNSQAVECITPALPRDDRASVVVTVDDQACTGTPSGVTVVVVGQRPGGTPSLPLQLRLGC